MVRPYSSALTSDTAAHCILEKPRFTAPNLSRFKPGANTST